MDVFQSLLSGGQTNHVSAELLETLGSQAARRYLDNGEQLNAAIKDLASQHSELQNEHIKRIVEFANNAVFQELHSKGSDKNVQFEVADPGPIIRDLKDGGSPAHDGKTLGIDDGKKDKGKTSEIPSEGDYYGEPAEGKSPSNDQGFSNFDSAFQEFMRQDQSSGIEGTGEQVKTASVINHEMHANPVDDVWDTHVRLQASESHIKEAHNQIGMIYKAAKEDFYQEAKKEVLNGGGMAEVIQAVKLAAVSDSVAFQALRSVAERLVKEGALRPGDMEKTAKCSMSLVNPEHPLVKAFAGLQKSAGELTKSRIALRELRAGLEKTGSFIKEQA